MFIMSMPQVSPQKQHGNLKIQSKLFIPSLQVTHQQMPIPYPMAQMSQTLSYDREPASKVRYKIPTTSKNRKFNLSLRKMACTKLEKTQRHNQQSSLD
jgi:hypothetical protein